MSVHDELAKLYGVDAIHERARSQDPRNLPIFDAPAGGRRVDQPDTRPPAPPSTTRVDTHPVVYWGPPDETPPLDAAGAAIQNGFRKAEVEASVEQLERETASVRPRCRCASCEINNP